MIVKVYNNLTTYKLFLASIIVPWSSHLNSEGQFF